MSFWPWSVVLGLVALNALYVAAEFSTVALRSAHLAPLARSGDRRAGALLTLINDGAARDRYIAACQIGITLSSLLAGAYAQASIAAPLAPLLARRFGWESLHAQSSAAVVVLLALTVLQVIFGELLPKSLALQFPERSALLLHPPMRWSVSIYRGLIWLLNGSAYLLLRPFGISTGGAPHVHSPEELELLFAESRRAGQLTPEVHERLQRGMRLSRRSVRQLMVPRGRIDAIEASTPHAEIVQRVLNSPYSRLPVYRGTIDHVLGSVSTKEIVGSYVAQGVIAPLEQLLRPIAFVPESLMADHLVRLLRTERTSKAIVIDEFGGVLGMISVDDLLSELFGELANEVRQEVAPGIELLRDGRVKLPASMRPDAARQWLGRPWEGTSATLGGLIVSKLGRLPQRGERVMMGQTEVTVLEVSPTAIVSIALRPPVRSKASG